MLGLELAFLVDQTHQLSCWLFLEGLQKEESTRSLWENTMSFSRNHRVDSLIPCKPHHMR